MSIEQIKNSSNIKKNTVVVDSEFKTTGTNTNFTYNLSNPINDVRLIEILNIEFNNDATNINNYSDNFTWTDTTGVTHNLSLTHDNYTIYNLMKTIQNEMNSQETDKASKYTLRLSNTDKVIFQSYYGITSFDLDFNVNNSIGDIIGFGITTFTGTTTYTSPNPIDMNYTKNLFVGSTNIAQSAFDISEISNGISNMIDKIQINKDYGDIIFSDKEKTIRNNINTLSTIDIRLLDDDGNDIDLQRGKFKITFDIYSRVFNNGFSI